MANQINEYQLTGNRTVLTLAYNVKLLTVRAPNDVPTLATLEDSDAPTQDRVIITRTAGETIGEGWLNYIGSYVLNGQTVHAFDRDPSAVD